MNEIWKDIENYEGCYQVSNLGRVKSVGRIVVRNNKIEQPVKERILKPEKNRGGYVQVILCKNGISKNFKVHRLVAVAFIGREDESFEVNHKDENKSNNRADNLEWISHIDNIRHGTGIKRKAISRSKPIIQIGLDGNAIKIWNNAREIERTLGFLNSSISRVCLGKNKTSYGFRWEFAK